MISPDYYKGSIDEYIKKIEYSLQRHSIKIMQYRNHSSPIDIFKVIADRLQQICNKRSITFIINNRMGTTDKEALLKLKIKYMAPLAITSKR